MNGRGGGFEPGASCAQGRRNISCKSFLFNLVFENKPVRKIFGSCTMYLKWLRMHAVPEFSPKRNNSKSAPIRSHRQPSNWSVELQFSAAMRRFMHFVTTFISRTLPIVAVSDCSTRTMCRIEYYPSTHRSIQDRNKPPPRTFFLPGSHVRRYTAGFATGEMALRLDERHNDHAYSAPKNTSDGK